ncbi:S-adenosyl-L-methionine-dependent methyltransferase [Podospora australis]|uniref:S-adenosyl-L-methionine-dependent methyltransferase n=1 Tax=Podospora australis TaxID=1536484 RepID=A0AAN6WZS8_9PEZI|nr:S-adenosyl-L-methionine-dependent methyltransferase [Podospora australis]
MFGKTGRNKEYFNKEAASYDSKHEKTLDQMIKEIRARVDFMGVDWVDEDGDDDDEEEEEDHTPKKVVRLLDYACGTGALAPYTTQCVGIDLSENMVATYNARAENQGLSLQEMHAYQGNLCSPSDPDPEAFASPEFRNFDITAVGLGFHHFDDPALAAKRLAERLKPGGVLLILDFFTHGTAEFGHEVNATITHHGFSEAEIQRIFEEAGVGKDFALDAVEPMVFHRATESRPEIRRRIFLARGTKEESSRVPVWMPEF